VYKQEHRLLDSLRAIFLFFLIPLPLMLNHRYALRLELQETVSTMLSRWTHTCFSELRLMVPPRESAVAIEREITAVFHPACHVTSIHPFRASEGRAFLSCDSSSPGKNWQLLRLLLPHSPTTDFSNINSPHPACRSYHRRRHQRREASPTWTSLGETSRRGRFVDCAHTDLRPRLFNTDRYSDMLIKFSGREIKAHRFVLCETSTYFAKLCGTNSEFMVRFP
jgi:hypothetical protein